MIGERDENVKVGRALTAYAKKRWIITHLGIPPAFRARPATVLEAESPGQEFAAVPQALLIDAVPDP